MKMKFSQADTDHLSGAKVRISNILHVIDHDKQIPPWLLDEFNKLINNLNYLRNSIAKQYEETELKSAIHGSGDCILYIDGHVNREGFILDYRHETGCDPTFEEVIHGYVTYKNGLSYFTKHMENKTTSEPVTYCDVN